MNGKNFYPIEIVGNNYPRRFHEDFFSDPKLMNACFQPFNLRGWKNILMRVFTSGDFRVPSRVISYFRLCLLFKFNVNVA